MRIIPTIECSNNGMVCSDKAGVLMVDDNGDEVSFPKEWFTHEKERLEKEFKRRLIEAELKDEQDRLKFMRLGHVEYWKRYYSK